MWIKPWKWLAPRAVEKEPTEFDISRRWFLLGSAAAVATAAIGLPALPTASQTPSLIANLGDDVGVRKIFDLCLDIGAKELFPVDFSIGRIGSEHDILHFKLASLATLRWRSIDEGDSLVVLGHQVLRITATPDPGPDAQLSLMYSGPRGGPFVEMFQWRDGEVIMHQRNSLYPQE